MLEGPTPKRRAILTVKIRLGVITDLEKINGGTPVTLSAAQIKLIMLTPPGTPLS